MKLYFQDKNSSLQLVNVQYEVDDFEKIRLKKVLISPEYLEQYLFISTRQLV